MDKSFVRDLFKILLLTSIFASCGQSLYYISKMSEESNKRRIEQMRQRNDYYYYKGYDSGLYK